MHLVGDLSSARLRDELVALLDEPDVAWTLQRLFELGVARQVHPKLATGERTVELIQAARRLGARVRPGGRRGALALAPGGGHPQHDPRRALHVAGTTTAPPRRRPRRAKECRARATAGRATRGRRSGRLGSLQSLGCGSCRIGGVRARSVGVGRGRGAVPTLYWACLRRRRLQITGNDVIALGARQGPRVGQVLEAVRRGRVEDRIGPGRQAELSCGPGLPRGRYRTR